MQIAKEFQSERYRMQCVPPATDWVRKSIQKALLQSFGLLLQRPRNASVPFLFENFEPGSVPTNEIDRNSFFQVGFFERLPKLLGIQDGLLVHRRNDIARLNAFAGGHGIFFDCDYDDAAGHRNGETIRYFASQDVNGEANTFGSILAGWIMLHSSE